MTLSYAHWTPEQRRRHFRHRGISRRTVLQMRAQGLSQRAIAKRLGVTHTTVQRHLRGFAAVCPGCGLRLTAVFMKRLSVGALSELEGTK